MSSHVEDESAPWRATLVSVWLSQFLSLSAFGFGIPFVAYYIQDLGVRDSNAVARWTALFQALAPLAFAISGPVWGVMADRYGRRLMLIRANIGAVVALFGMSIAPNVFWLMVCRVLQGALTGTVSAAITLVTVATPRSRHGAALGALSSAVFSGMLAGSFFGGICADAFGYAKSFQVAAVLSLLAALVVWIGAKEPLPAKTEVEEVTQTPPSTLRLLPRPGAALPLLVLIMVSLMPVLMDRPVMPLFVQMLKGGNLSGASTWMGIVEAAGSLSAMLAGFTTGLICDRYRPDRVARWMSIGAGAALLPIAFASSFWMLLVGRFVMMYFVGSLNPIFQILLSRIAPKDRMGALFGLATTFRSGAWFLAPFLGAAVMNLLGLRAAFLVQAGMFGCLVFVLGFFARRGWFNPTDRMATQ